MKELKSNEPFEVAQGGATISFEIGCSWLMLPYSSFVFGKFKAGHIALNFGEWSVEVEGANLEEVWRLLQSQNLRSLRLSSDRQVPPNSNCEIVKIAAAKSAS